MTDSTHAEWSVARLARVRDEELDGLEASTAARILLASLVAGHVCPHGPAASRWWGGRPARRLALAAAAAVAVTVAVVVGPSLLAGGTGGATSYANSAIEVTREGRFFVARIKDPLADRAKYVEAFRAVGKDVDIELAPVSPRLVGQLLESSSGGSSGLSHVEVHTDFVSAGPESVDCALLPARCMLVIRISVNTTGWVRYKLGRAALPGETYQDPVRGPGAGPSNSGSSGGSGSGGSGN
jgi:hypothetical protein